MMVLTNNFFNAENQAEEGLIIHWIVGFIVMSIGKNYLQIAEKEAGNDSK